MKWKAKHKIQKGQEYLDTEEIEEDNRAEWQKRLDGDYDLDNGFQLKYEAPKMNEEVRSKYQQELNSRYGEPTEYKGGELPEVVVMPQGGFVRKKYDTESNEYQNGLKGYVMYKGSDGRYHTDFVWRPQQERNYGSAFNPHEFTDITSKVIGKGMEHAGNSIVHAVNAPYRLVGDVASLFGYDTPSHVADATEQAIGQGGTWLLTNPVSQALFSYLTPSKYAGWAATGYMPHDERNTGFGDESTNLLFDLGIGTLTGSSAANASSKAARVIKYSQPKYWRYHFRNSMVPSGYQNFGERVGNYIRNIFSGENPIPPGKQPWLIEGTPEYEKYAKALKPYLKNMPGFTIDDLIRARQDAINIYSGASQQFNTFKIVGKNEKGQLIVDFSDAIRKKIVDNGLSAKTVIGIINKLRDNPGSKLVYPDMFTAAGGNAVYSYTPIANGMYKSDLINYNYGILKMNDIQDYQPFIRNGDHVSQRLKLNEKADNLIKKARDMEDEVYMRNPDLIQYEMDLSKGLIHDVKPKLSMADQMKLKLSKVQRDAGMRLRKFNDKIDAKTNNFEISSIIPGAKPYVFVTEQPITTLSRGGGSFMGILPLEISDNGVKIYNKAQLGITPVEGNLLPYEVIQYRQFNPIPLNKSLNPIIASIY